MSVMSIKTNRPYPCSSGAAAMTSGQAGKSVLWSHCCRQTGRKMCVRILASAVSLTAAASSTSATLAKAGDGCFKQSAGTGTKHVDG